jgi:hypothetical protein
MAILNDYAAFPDDPPDYVVDLFISYKRDPQIEYWMSRVVEIIDRELTNELGGPCTIFFDRASIPPGSNWKTTLQRGLQGSRCMMGFWSPSYFTASEWCVTEWQTFKAREVKLELPDGGLTLPVRRDKGPLPVQFSAIQLPDLSSYSSTLPAFWDTGRALLLEDQLKLLIVHLANRITHAPEFDEFPFLVAQPYPKPPYQPRFGGRKAA